MEYKQLTPKEEMGCKLILLFWFIGFCVIMSSPIWLNVMFGLGIMAGMLALSIGFGVWMLVLAMLMM